ncbi:MAG: BamA/TamA family outer membrane protein [Pseudomonadota bacterium]
MMLRKRRDLAVAAGFCLIWASPLAAQEAAPPVAADLGALDPNSPLTELPDIGVAWPDLANAPVEAPDPDARTDITGEIRYGFRVEGIDAVATPLLRQRFAELSVLDANDGDPANAAQIDRRAREDAELLTTLLRGEGYYDAQVTTAVATEAGRLQVTLTAEPGVLYRFERVTLAGVEQAGAKTAALTDAFGVAQNAPVNADAIAGGEAKLTTEVGRQGFAFGQVGDSAIVVDRSAKTATLDLSVVPGTPRKFGRIVMTERAGRRVFGARHTQEIARFEPGDDYDAAALDDLRRALIQTGLVSSAEVKPVAAGDPALVDISVALEPAPPRTVAGEIGYGTGEGIRTELSWTHRNLFPPEGALTLRGVLGTREQLGNVIFRRNNFRGRDRVLTAQVIAANLKRDAYEARTFALSGALERQTNIFFQKTWTWSLGAELAASDERDVERVTGLARRRTFFIGALPTSLAYDGSDDLLNPTRGFRLGGRLSPEFSFQGSAFGYARVQLDASAYQPFGTRVVLAQRVRLGTIAGAPRDAVAPSRRFYAGGGGSVRGYGFQAIGPRDVNNDPIGGRSLAEFSLEARVKAFGNFGIVPFLDGGNISTDPLPRFGGLRLGTGLGVRYYSSFGPIRLDVGTPINPRQGDTRITVYVSLGQAF